MEHTAHNRAGQPWPSATSVEGSAANENTTPASVPAKRPRGRPRIESREQLLGQKVRMALLTALTQVEAVTFMRLRAIVNTNDGNLSIHARKLERAGYIRIEKKFAGRMPRTEYSLTDVGRRALESFQTRSKTLGLDAD